VLDLANGGRRQVYRNAFSQGTETLPINGLVWMGDAGFMREQIGQKLAAGYSCLKLKIGSLDFATELALLRVGRAFASYSGELLGGLGELEPERGLDARLCGLRLSVQPSGKRTRNLNLLSTGERTMAGLAFLFALAHAPEDRELAASGLPLAVLDEVDAPLDEANIRRFTRFLTLFAARGSQFLLVTHQKATMEVANTLWGVTTDASGASRVLSIRQTEDAQATA